MGLHVVTHYAQHNTRAYSIIRLSRVSYLIKNSAVRVCRTRASMRRLLFIRLFVYSRVKGWLNRSVRATRERLYSGHCFHAAGEKNSAVRWSRDLQPVAIGIV